MTLSSIHLVPVLVATAVSMVIGAVWYSPALFGNQWMRLAGLDTKESKKNSPVRAMTICFILTIVIAVILQMFLRRTTADTFIEGATAALWYWALVMSVVSIHGVFQGKPVQMLLITGAHELVSFAVMGGILAAWR